MKNIRSINYAQSGIRVLSLSILFFGLVITGCDSTSNVSESTSIAPSNVVTVLQDNIQLSDAQVRDLEDVVSGDVGDARDAGDAMATGRMDSWKVAAYLQEALSDDQKRALLDRAAEVQVQRRERLAATSHRKDGGRASSIPGRRARQGQLGDGHRVDSLLALTEDQRTMLKESREVWKAKANEFREDGSPSEAEIAEMKALRLNNREQFEATLSADQKQKLEDRRERSSDRAVTRSDDHRRKGVRRQLRNEARKSDGQQRGTRHGEMDALDLSDQQHEAIKQLRESARLEFEALKGETGRSERREAFSELRTATAQKIDAILTTEQKELKELHQAVGTILRSSRHGDRANGGSANRQGRN